MWSSLTIFLFLSAFQGAIAAITPCKIGGCPDDRCDIEADGGPGTPSFPGCADKTCRCFDTNGNGIAPNNFKTSMKCVDETDASNGCYLACKNSKSTVATFQATKCVAGGDKTKYCYCRSVVTTPIPKCSLAEGAKDCAGFCESESRRNCLEKAFGGICTCNARKTKASCEEDSYCRSLCRAAKNARPDNSKESIELYTFNLGHLCTRAGTGTTKKNCICSKVEPDN